MAKVVLYTKDYCPYCIRAKNLLVGKNIDFEEIDLSDDFEKLHQIKEQTGWQTVPIILINEKIIGGYTELRALDQQGQLDELLKS